MASSQKSYYIRLLVTAQPLHIIEMKYTLLLFFLLIFNYQLLAQIKEAKKLHFISSLTVNNETIDIAEDSLLNKYITIQKIDKKVYLEKKKTAVTLFIADTTIKKENAIIALPFHNGKREFVDKDPFDETKEEYSYLGQIKFLNVYLIKGLYWETLDYKFISKHDGKEIASFGSMPYISSNKKFIISVYDNPYTTEADFELFSIEKNKVITIFRTSFKNWMPAPNSEMFWNRDGSFYLPILYATEYWKKEGNSNDNFEYIKITMI
jgi:hypothetical protein